MSIIEHPAASRAACIPRSAGGERTARRSQPRRDRGAAAIALALALCAGCSSDDAAGPVSTTDTVSGAAETTTGGDAGAQTADAGPKDEAGPVLSGLAIQGNPRNDLSALVSFETDEPATWTLEVTDELTGRSWTVDPHLTAESTHNVPVLGLRPARTHRLRLTVTDAAGNATIDESLTKTTGPLPDDFPPMKLLKAGPPDLGAALLLDVLWWGKVLSYGLLVAVDNEGEVVWYERADRPLVETLRTDTGSLLVVVGESDGIQEIDMFGNVLNDWVAKKMGLDSLHHTVGLTPSGNLLGLSTELRHIAGYPPPDGTATWPVVGDIAVEFTREGQVVNAWPFLDVLDPYHYNELIFQPFWLPLYPVEGLPKDWSHGNAILYDAADESYVVSLAAQDMVVKLDRATGQPVWKAGESGDVTLVGGGEWFSMPHGIEWTEDGRMLLYDDGIYKPEPRGRVVEYALKAPEGGGPWTATQTMVWDGGDQPFCSMGPSDVDRLPNGDLLVLHGSLLGDPTASPFDGANPLYVRLEQIHQEPLGERVFAMEIGGPWDPSGNKFSSFAVERLPSLYPPGWEMSE